MQSHYTTIHVIYYITLQDLTGKQIIFLKGSLGIKTCMAQYNITDVSYWNM